MRVFILDSELVVAAGPFINWLESSDIDVWWSYGCTSIEPLAMLEEEIIGCATVNNVELAKSVSKFGGIIISRGKKVSDWCDRNDPPAWKECSDWNQATVFLPLQQRVCRG